MTRAVDVTDAELLGDVGMWERMKGWVCVVV